MIAFYCILKSGVHLQTREVSDRYPKVDALCISGSKESSSRNRGSAPQQSFKVGYRYSVEISLR